MRETRYFLIIVLIGLLSFSIVQPVNSVETDRIELDAIKLGIATRLDSATIDLFLSEFVKSDYAADVGITSTKDIAVYTPTTYESFSRAMTAPEFEVSLAWSGSLVLFNNLAEEGAIQPISNQTFINEINNTYPLTIGNSKMRSYDNNSDLIWAATSFTSYGFTVNHDVLQTRGLPVPLTWEDLASPEFFTSVSQPNIGMGNAPDSRLSTQIYQIILQKYGWERGWQIINDMAGNGKFYSGYVEGVSSVVSGETAVALTTDSYGLFVMSKNPATEYIIPENGTRIEAIPIAYSKAPPHQDAADAFIKFVLSQEGQALWLNDTVNRLPIREDAFDTDYANDRDDIDFIYNLYNETLSNLYIQFNDALALSFEETMRSHFEATITDVHTKLRSTWGELVSTYQAGSMNQNRFNEINDYFGKAALNQSEAISHEFDMTDDASFRDDTQNAWTEFANDKFDFVLAMIEDDNLYDPDKEPATEDTSTPVDTIDTDIPIDPMWFVIPLMIIPIIRRKNKVILI